MSTEATGTLYGRHMQPAADAERDNNMSAAETKTNNTKQRPIKTTAAQVSKILPVSLLPGGCFGCFRRLSKALSFHYVRQGRYVMRKIRNTDLDELKQRLRTEWTKLDHVVTVAAIRQWRRR